MTARDDEEMLDVLIEREFDAWANQRGFTLVYRTTFRKSFHAGFKRALELSQTDGDDDAVEL
jgi:hypothetical protein